jgi:hypothetical protein
VHDRAVACGREAGDLADGSRFFVPGGHEGAWLDLAGVAGFVEEVPDVAGAVVRDSPDHAAFLPVRTVVGSVGLQPSWPEADGCDRMRSRHGA